MKKKGIVITRDQIWEEEPYKFTAEAAEIGLAPGEWPARIAVAPDVGNGCFLFRVAKMFGGRRSEFQGFAYNQQNGCISVMIFND